ncbi:hypothetical protein [Deinococcus sp.]|uniref:hypothetical protein n=1 Tax=Deinococcus sp. TaxID=47478 RepID=UPI0025BC562C|nr:hypothetical protein [Deinococcus sp.]
MKKTLIGLLALSAVSTASADSYVGGSIGSGLSLHYQTDRTATSAMRYSLNLDATQFNFNQLTLGGSVDYLSNFAGQSLGSGLTPYYGLGLGAGVALGDNYSGVGVYPHGILGLKYQISTPLSTFGEVNAGPYIDFGSGGGIGFGYNLRIGINYVLNR